MVKMRIAIYSIILLSTMIVSYVMIKGNFGLFGIVFTAAFFILINRAYAKIAIGIILDNDEVTFETVCGKKIRTKQENIISIRKTLISDHELGSFNFCVKGVGAVMAGICFIEPLVMKNGKVYADIKISDFPYAEFINFDY